MDSDSDESSSSDLVGQDDPNIQILCNHLKDPTFVEYINSFLLLPAFSNRLFYNKDTGYFEQVHNDGMVCWDGAITPSSSLSTLYLPQDTIGETLEKEQSLQWVSQYRLPLFFKSDLFSEYKISKLLSCVVPEKSSWKHRASISTPLESSGKESSSTLNLPEISYHSISESASTVDLEMPSKPLGIPASRSDAVLETKKVGRRVRWQRSLSMDPDVLALPGSSGSESLSLSSVNSDTTSTSRRTKSELHDRQFLSSKSDMTALWKFLKGKAGEKNWLFWLDAERIKYYSNDEDQQRLVKDLRERYLHSGSLLELPADTSMRIRLSKSSQLTMEQIAELQDAMITKLKDYWCPRFLLHCFKEQDLSASSSICSSSYITSSKATTVFRSCSTAPAAFHGLTDTKQSGYSNVITPLTPTHTPTYRKLGRDRPKSSIAFYHRPEKECTSNSADMYFAENTFKEVPGHPAGVASLLAERLKEYAINDSPLTRKKWTRKVWGTGMNSPVAEPQKTNADRGGEGEGEGGGGGRGGGGGGRGGGGGGGKTESSAVKYSQLAKYAPHHLPDPESRCASRMEGSIGSDGICKNQCRVLSVSGTPTHTSSFNLRPASTTDHDASKTAYEPLLRCLAMEYRKAGGYFMQYLEKLEDSVYINCLRFWREVQEYKALFIQVNFSPCAVEMKAKTLFGRYISECCTKAIQCSPEVTGAISANLWPAYEDLFDEAEEHALDMLLSQWNDLCNSEDTTFQKLETIQLASHMQSLGTVTESTFHLSDIERYSSGASVSTTSSGAISLDMILSNMSELEYFKIFLNKNCAAEDLMCWMDIEAFRGVPVTDRYVRNVKAKQLKKQYMNKGYFFGSNSPANKEGQRQTKLAGGVNSGARLPSRPRTPVFREAQKHVRARLEKKWLVMFINSSGFLERNQKSFSKSGGGMKSHQFVSEHTFINSHQAILFRKFLQTRTDSDDFMRYLKIKSMSEYSNLGIKFSKEDLRFWYEVQKYKGMFHAHTLDSILDSKVTAIIDCFFNSTVPPQLQIDIPLSLADQVARKPAGPYLFRESQAVIFKLLYSGWKEFKNFIIGLDNNQINLALDRLEKENIANRRRKWELEERSKKEEDRRRLMLPRFETMEEREQRQIQEKELEEFGPTAVEFRLSTPNTSQYMYYTDLPTKKRPRSVINITKPGSARRPKYAKKEEQSVKKKSSKKTVTAPEVQVTVADVAPAPWIERMKKEDNSAEDFPIVEMKLCGRRASRKTDFDIEDKLPVSKQKLEVGMSLKHCLTSPAVTGRNKADNSKINQPTVMKTIRMQLQVSTSGTGDSFAYGGALPNDSYLTKTERRLKLNFL